MDRLRHILAAAWFAVLAAVPAVSTAQTPAQRFVHPEGLFTLMVPESADARAGDGPVAVKVVSRHGWVLTVQSGPSNRDLDFRGMITKLEDRYLGENKAWAKKIGERTAIIGGLPALEAVYEATRSRWQVTIARGRFTDFVILLSAPPELYSERGHEIGGVLSSFAPRAQEVPTPVAAQPAQPPRAASEPPPPPAMDAGGLSQRFSEPVFGFSIGYPADWTVSRDDPYTAVFSGGAGTEAYYATVSLQNVSPPGAADPVAAAEAAFDERRAQMAAAAADLAYVSEEPFAYDRGGVRLMGQAFVATYSWDRRKFSAWVVVLPNPGHPVAHIFSYAAPHDRFQTYRPVAEAMLHSWTIHGTEEAGATR